MTEVYFADHPDSQGCVRVDDIIRHDGNTFQSIADYKVRQFVLNGINPDNQLLAHVASNIPTDFPPIIPVPIMRFPIAIKSEISKYF